MRASQLQRAQQRSARALGALAAPLPRVAAPASALASLPPQRHAAALAARGIRVPAGCCASGRLVAAAAAAQAPMSQPAEPGRQDVPAHGADAGDGGLLPEEDYEVPGTYMDAMNGNTKLGKAVRAAVEELEHLGDLESETLQQCDDLLRKLGMRGSIFGAAGRGVVADSADGGSAGGGAGGGDIGVGGNVGSAGGGGGANTP